MPSTLEMPRIRIPGISAFLSFLFSSPPSPLQRPPPTPRRLPSEKAGTTVFNVKLNFPERRVPF